MPTNQTEEWRNSEDYKLAVFFANELLDVPYADPDDHARTVARQFLRMIDRLDASLLSEKQKIVEEIREEIEVFESEIAKREIGFNTRYAQQSTAIEILHLPSLQPTNNTDGLETGAIHTIGQAREIVDNLQQKIKESNNTKENK